MKYLISLASFMMSFVSFGQSIFQNSDASNALFATESTSKAVYVNSELKEQKISGFLNSLAVSSNAKALSYTNQIRLGGSNCYLGVDLEGKSNTSYAKMFENGDLAPGARLAGTLGYLYPFNSIENIRKEINLIAQNKDLEEKEKEKKIDEEVIKLSEEGLWIYFSQKYEGRAFNQYIPNVLFNSEIIEVRNKLHASVLGVNYFHKNFAGLGAVMLGTSYGIETTDNFKDMFELSVSTSFSSKDTINGASRTVTQKLTAYQGEYKPDLSKKLLSFDLYFAPKYVEQIGLLLNYTLNNFEDEDIFDTKDLSLGLFFYDKKPFSPKYGLVFKYADVGIDNLNFPQNKSRFSIGVTTQFNLGQKKYKSANKEKDKTKPKKPEELFEKTGS